MLRFVVHNSNSYNFLAFVGSFGHETGGGWNSPSVTLAYQTFSQIGMSLFYAGLLLTVAAVLAWLFTKQPVEDRAAP